MTDNKSLSTKNRTKAFITDTEELGDDKEVIVDGNRKNNFLSLKDKAEILQRLDQGALASNLAREYGISKSTVSRFKKRKDTIQNAVTSIFPNNTDRRTMRGTFYKKTETALYQWYLKQCEQSVEVTGSMLREKAQSIYNECEVSNYSFCASVGWLTKFKRRYGIKLSHKTTSNVEETAPNTSTEDDPLIIDEQEHRAIPQNTTHCVDKKEAIRCIDTVIRWSTENSVDSLYLTMLRSLKNQVKLGPKIKYVCK